MEHTETVVSMKTKLDGVERSHAATVVHTGPEGTWLFSPAGTVIAGPDGPVGVQRADGVQFYPARRLPSSGGWYVAWCWAVAAEPANEYWSRPWISVDIADFGGSPFSFVDLELDLWCDASSAGIVDQDELDAAEAAGWLSPSEATIARRAADELYQDLRHGCRDAFAGAGWSLLERIRGRPADHA